MQPIRRSTKKGPTYADFSYNPFLAQAPQPHHPTNNSHEKQGRSYSPYRKKLTTGAIANFNGDNCNFGIEETFGFGSMDQADLFSDKAKITPKNQNQPPKKDQPSSIKQNQ